MDFDKEFQAAPLPADCVPPEICEQHALGAIFHYPTQVAAVYCECSQCGAELPANGTWHVTHDITRAEFQEELITRLVVAGVLADRKAKAH